MGLMVIRTGHCFDATTGMGIWLTYNPTGPLPSIISPPTPIQYILSFHMAVLLGPLHTDKHCHSLKHQKILTQQTSITSQKTYIINMSHYTFSKLPRCGTGKIQMTHIYNKS